MEIKTEYQKLLNYYNSKKFDLVINKSKGFIKNFGAIPEVFNLVGLSYEMLNKKIEAIENFEKSLELNTKNVSALVNLGNNHKDLKNFKKSEEYYKKLIEEIEENSSIQIIVKDKNDEAIIELLNDLLIELEGLNNLRKIESLEKELINNLDENSYSELIKLKSQVNRE